MTIGVNCHSEVLCSKAEESSNPCHSELALASEESLLLDSKEMKDSQSEKGIKN
ncbi:hypothetical protein [Helicobacter sp. MIT 14-3879]|uniref:hypothetical protein n=1 Tax=Helicobacter sp. MIT 14-3879 TaxID=2040649 RepID=UPI0015F1AF88|nr:hypothetical protein [Helicobacter sp. MIT 14-3879]